MLAAQLSYNHYISPHRRHGSSAGAIVLSVHSGHLRSAIEPRASERDAKDSEDPIQRLSNV
jgi:hypothetical protein